MIQHIVKLRLAGPVIFQSPYIHPPKCGEMGSFLEGIVTMANAWNAVQREYEGGVVATMLTRLQNLHQRSLPVMAQCHLI
jgi:hypothetical protein